MVVNSWPPLHALGETCLHHCPSICGCVYCVTSGHWTRRSGYGRSPLLVLACQGASVNQTSQHCFNIASSPTQSVNKCPTNEHESSQSTCQVQQTWTVSLTTKSLTSSACEWWLCISLHGEKLQNAGSTIDINFSSLVASFVSVTLRNSPRQSSSFQDSIAVRREYEVHEVIPWVQLMSASPQLASSR